MIKHIKTDSIKSVLSYNPILLNIESLISKYLPILHADLDLKETSPRKSITTVDRRQNKNKKQKNKKT